MWFQRHRTGHGKWCPERPSDLSKHRERSQSLRFHQGVGPLAWLKGRPFCNRRLNGTVPSLARCYSLSPQCLTVLFQTPCGHPHRRTLSRQGSVKTRHSLSWCDVPGCQPGRSALVNWKVSQPSRFCLQNAPTPELPVSPTLPISRSPSLPKCPSQLNFSRLLLPRGKQGGDFFGPQAPKRTKETRPTRAFRFPLNCSAPRSALPAAAASPRLFRISVANSTAKEWSRARWPGVFA